MTTPWVAPLEKTSLRERVKHALRAAIVSGEMETGAVYSAPSLGTRFGVSATPVREAMLDLAKENLVEIVPNKGFRVTEVTDQDLDDITELRLLIEPLTVRAASALIPDGDFGLLRSLAGDIVAWAEKGDLVAYTEADRVFHLKLLSYTGNKHLVELVSDLRAHTRLLGLPGLLESGELVDVAREHLSIVDTIQTRDADAVEAMMRAHISQVRGRWASRSGRTPLVTTP